jgi:hypothetical protein
MRLLELRFDVAGLASHRRREPQGNLTALPGESGPMCRYSARRVATKSVSNEHDAAGWSEP